MQKQFSKLAIASLLLWTVTIGIFGTFFIKGWTTPSTDHRLSVKLAPSERDLVLTEMRGLLKAVNGVFKGLSENDRAMMVTATSSVGMAMAADVNPVLLGKLPVSFKTLGMSVHADFDSLSAEIKAGASNEIVLKRMTNITSKCIACHQAYNLGLSN